MHNLMSPAIIARWDQAFAEHKDQMVTSIAKVREIIADVGVMTAHDDLMNALAAFSTEHKDSNLATALILMAQATEDAMHDREL